MEHSETSDRSFKWLVLEWLGKWVISDGWHGGINPGPYESEEDAHKAILVYAKRESDYYGENVESIISRHTIIKVNWPKDLK